MTQEKESFASLFATDASTPRVQAFQLGDDVESVVVSIGKEVAIVDLDGKHHGFLDVNELRLPDGTVPTKVGDTIKAKVIAFEPGGDVRLGRSLSRASMGRAIDAGALEAARDQGVPIEGKVTKAVKAGIEVDVNGVRAFCPASQIGGGFVADFGEHVGKTYAFRVLEVKDGGRSVIVSRKSVLEEERRYARDRILGSLRVGQVLRGPVTNVRDFGAFVDLGGAEGLVPARELSRDRVAPSDVVKVGDLIEVVVKEIQTGEEKARITLSVKDLTPDPWDGIATIAPVGQVVSGTVSRLADFGAFVRLAAGVEGLLHISELGAKVEHASAVLKAGQTLSLVVKSVDPAAHRISLTLAPEGATVGTAAPRGPDIFVGLQVECAVEKHEQFGVFVQIQGTTGRSGRGLIPNIELGLPRGADVRKELPIGTKLSAKVLEVGDGRLRLSVRALKDDAERAEFEGYKVSMAAPKGMGTLGDLLKKKLGG